MKNDLNPNDQNPMKPIQAVQTALLAGIFILLLLLVVHRQGMAAVHYNYQEFTWPTNAGAFGTWDEDGVPYRMFQRWVDVGDPTGTRPKSVESFPVRDPADAMESVGNDGWQFVWSDGVRYIMRRPDGHWGHDSFTIDALPADTPVFPKSP